MKPDVALWADDFVIPALLSSARRPYGQAIVRRMAAAGFDDMPRRGTFVLASIANNASNMGGVANLMAVSKQAVSQLVDALVSRGYLRREHDPDDRRRMTLTLTERGLAAATESLAAVAEVDAALEELVGAEAVATTRRVLGAMSDLSAADSGPR